MLYLQRVTDTNKKISKDLQFEIVDDGACPIQIGSGTNKMYASFINSRSFHDRNTSPFYVIFFALCSQQLFHHLNLIRLTGVFLNFLTNQ